LGKIDNCKLVKSKATIQKGIFGVCGRSLKGMTFLGKEKINCGFAQNKGHGFEIGWRFFEKKSLMAFETESGENECSTFVYTTKAH
jgi:hypothetical protein